MTQEELKVQIKPVLDLLDTLPVGQVIVSNWEAPEGYELEKLKVGEANVDHLVPEKKNGKVILHLHGGGYIIALLDTYRDLAVMYSQMAGGAEVFSVDYRVAPTDLAPSALEDAVLAYQYILSKGYKSEDIVLIGDSAGGNLVLITTLYLKEHQMPLPKGVIAISPWACIDTTPESRRVNEKKDIVIGSLASSMFEEVMDSRYYKNSDKKAPLTSPVYGDYKGFPSLLLQVGSYEILRDDTLMVAKAAKEAGVDVTQTTYNEMSHDFQLFLPHLEESKQAWAEMKEFIDRIFTK